MTGEGGLAAPEGRGLRRPRPVRPGRAAGDGPAAAPAVRLVRPGPRCRQRSAFCRARTTAPTTTATTAARRAPSTAVTKTISTTDRNRRQKPMRSARWALRRNDGRLVLTRASARCRRGTGMTRGPLGRPDGGNVAGPTVVDGPGRPASGSRYGSDRAAVGGRQAAGPIGRQGAGGHGLTERRRVPAAAIGHHGAGRAPAGPGGAAGGGVSRGRGRIEAGAAVVEVTGGRVPAHLLGAHATGGWPPPLAGPLMAGCHRSRTGACRHCPAGTTRMPACDVTTTEPMVQDQSVTELMPPPRRPPVVDPLHHRDACWPGRPSS